MENLFLQIDKLRYNSVKELKLTYCQRGILQGAYHKHKSLAHFTEKLQNADLDLTSWDGPHAFHKHVSQIFTNQKIYKDGKMTNISAHQVGEARAASGMHGGTFDTISICSTQNEADVVMKTTNCPLCRLPKGHAKSHHITRCPFTKSMGLNIR